MSTNAQRAFALLRDVVVGVEQRDRSELYPDGFFRWLELNPIIVLEFVDRARQVKASGRSRFSARAIIENIRWHTLLADREATFKINDHWTPGLARLAMALDPALEGMFELRPGRAIVDGADCESRTIAEIQLAGVSMVEEPVYPGARLAT